MAQKEALYTVELFNGKEAVGLQSAISARTALAAIKTAIKEHNRVASRKGSGMQMATRGRIWSILADGKITRLRKPKNPTTTDKRKCANCGKMFTPDNPNDKSENVCSRACVREFVLRGGKGRLDSSVAPRKRNVQVNSFDKAEIMPLIDDDNPDKPKIIWSVIWGVVGQRQGKDFSDLSAAKRWANDRFGRANVNVRPLAKKYRSFLKNGLKTQFGLHG